VKKYFVDKQQNTQQLALPPFRVNAVQCVALWDCDAYATEGDARIKHHSGRRAVVQSA